MSKLKIAGLILSGLVILTAGAISFRHQLIVNLYKNTPVLLAKVDEGPNVEWFDDYYTIQKLDEGVYAISEPLYWQRNINYLIVGEESALLIDAGPGVRDIRPVVKSITDLPYTFITTHFHFDHAGNGVKFPNVAMVDLPYLRKRAVGNTIALSQLETMGKPEGYEAPVLTVDKWVKPDERINLGNHSVRIIYTPGHTVESISILDEDRDILFTGDWFTPVLGPMFSNSNMGDFLMATSNVLCVISKTTRIFGAHRYQDGGGAPEQTFEDIVEAKKGLELIQSGKLKGSGFYPVQYQISPAIQMYADVAWFHKWKPTYPKFRSDICNPS